MTLVAGVNLGDQFMQKATPSGACFVLETLRGFGDFVRDIDAKDKVVHVVWLKNLQYVL
jgi:hypothetical protein